MTETRCFEYDEDACGASVPSRGERGQLGCCGSALDHPACDEMHSMVLSPSRALHALRQGSLLIGWQWAGRG